MPPIRRILETAVYCDDLVRAAEFYERLLRASPILSNDRLVAFDAGSGTMLLLFRRGQPSAIVTDGGIVPGHDGSGSAHLAFAIDAADMSAWERRLSALGIAIESRVTWGRGGQSLYFRDPDGHSIELATPGTWPTY